MEEKQDDQTNSEQTKSPAKPNETANFTVDGFVRIFDPQTKEVILEKRA